MRWLGCWESRCWLREDWEEVSKSGEGEAARFDEATPSVVHQGGFQARQVVPLSVPGPSPLCSSSLLLLLHPLPSHTMAKAPLT